jgi:hypothetical protein
VRRAGAAALAALALLVAGCGAEDQSERLIPADDAESLRATLEQVEAARAAGRCQEARSLTLEARDRARELPDTLDAELRRRIHGGISRIFDLLPSQCELPGEDTPAETTDAPAETQDPEPTTQEPDPETQEPPTTETPPPTTETPAAPEGEDDGGTGGEDGGSSGSGSTGSGTGGVPAEEVG